MASGNLEKYIKQTSQEFINFINEKLSELFTDSKESKSNETITPSQITFNENKITCFEKYTNCTNGFINLTKLSTSITNIENCSLNRNEVLKLLGNIRIKSIEFLTRKALEYLNLIDIDIEQEPTLFIDARGSINITSDYDVTFHGKNTSFLIYFVFTVFSKAFPNTILPQAFDTNLYPPIGAYNKKSLITNDFSFLEDNLGDKIIDLGDGLFSILNLGNYENEYIWAFLKLYNGIEIFNKIAGNDNQININDLLTQNTIKKIKKLKEGLKQIEQKLIQTTGVPCFDEEKIRYEIMWNLVYFADLSLIDNSNPYELLLNTSIPLINSEHLNEHLNEYLLGELKKVLPTIINFINTTEGFGSLIKYFSSEAYYSSYTVFDIVVRGILKNKYPLHPNVLLVSAIENMGDLITHISHSLEHLENNQNETTFNLLLKFSKYLQRIHRACYGVYKNDINNTDIKNKLKKLVDIDERNAINRKLSEHKVEEERKSFSSAMLREEKSSEHKIIQTFPDAIYDKDGYISALKGHIYFLFGLLKKKIPASFVNDSAEQNSSGGKKTKKKKSKKRRKKTKKRKRKKRRKTRRKKKTRKRRKY